MWHGLQDRHVIYGLFIVEELFYFKHAAAGIFPSYGGFSARHEVVGSDLKAVRYRYSANHVQGRLQMNRTAEEVVATNQLTPCQV